MSHIDPLFRDQLRNLEIQPSESAWERIQAAGQAKKERRLGFWIPAVAAGLAIAIVSSVVLLRSSGKMDTGTSIAIESQEEKAIPAKYPVIRTYPLEKEAITQNSAPKQSTSSLEATSTGQDESVAPSRHRYKNQRIARKNKIRQSLLQLEQTAPGINPEEAPVFAQQYTDPQAIDSLHSIDFNTVPVYKPRTTTIEDFAEVDMLPLDPQEIADLPQVEEKPRSNPSRIRIESHITSRDLIAAADDTPKVIAQSRKWWQLAERKVESLAQQIRLPFNL